MMLLPRAAPHLARTIPIRIRNIAMLDDAGTLGIEILKELHNYVILVLYILDLGREIAHKDDPLPLIFRVLTPQVAQQAKLGFARSKACRHTREFTDHDGLVLLDALSC
eukprot:1087290-Pyramimonas_sp.AAC.1